VSDAAKPTDLPADKPSERDKRLARFVGLSVFRFEQGSAGGGTVIPINDFLVLGSILFGIGMYGVLARRNAVLILMGVELMLQAVSINFITFAAYLDPQNATGVIFAIFVIVIAAAEAGLALAIILRLFRNRQTANVDEADMMKW
jgi:NADH:ubiquinone oxidoreductase subunit K